MQTIQRDAFTARTGYEPGIVVDGIELRDQVWLDYLLEPAEPDSSDHLPTARQKCPPAMGAGRLVRGLHGQ
jgi:hypothetical protein